VLTLSLNKRYVPKLESFVSISCPSLVIQFKDTFVKYFSSHQFGVTMLGGCKTMVHGVKATLNLQPKWVVLHVDVRNAFNLVFRATIFQELRSFINTLDQLFPFVRWFYACSFSLYFSKASSRHGDFTIISSKSNTQHGDPLGGMLFALAHFRTLCPTTTTHFTCVFLSLANDTHIVGPASNVLPFFYDYKKSLAQTFNVVDKVCHLVSTRFRYHSISLLPDFLTLKSSFHIPGVLMDSLPFVESFISEVLQEDFNMIANLPMFVDSQTTFAMFSLCYAQRPSYLQCSIFPSPCIL